MFSKRENRSDGDGFSSVDTQMGVIKLTLAGTIDTRERYAGTQDWWCRFSPLLDY